MRIAKRYESYQVPQQPLQIVSLQKKKKKGKKTKETNCFYSKVEIHEIKKEKLTPGVYIRSQKLPIVKPAMQPKVLKVMEELGIGK
jgi:DNA methyltransferase 1-associated protein 1